MPFSSRRRRNEGFTLIETLVVLGVLGLALALIGSYGQPASGSLALRHAAGELAGGLREARSQAIADNRMATVSLDLANRRWRIDKQAEKSFPDGIQIDLLTIAGENSGESRGIIRFLPDGSATGGRIAFIGAHRHIQIAVDWLTGRVSQIATP
jgi:general secretion pathway protein H